MLALALAIDINGFIAAFVCGLTFGAVLDERVVDVAQASELTELGGELLALLVWLVFGAALVPVAFGVLDVRLVAYALASLTLVRMVPVGLALLGSDLDRPSTLFLAWFGPRGLASVVFAVLALEELGNGSAATERAVAAIALTVLLSVALHGATAGPGGARYLRREGGAADTGPAPRGRRPSLSRSTEERS